jgi:hypothetical protein
MHTANLPGANLKTQNPVTFGCLGMLELAIGLITPIHQVVS